MRRRYWLIILTVFILVSCDRDALKHLDNASKFFNLGMYEQAVVELKSANRFLKDDKYFQDSMYRDLMWGIIALKSGDQAKALENFSLALQKEPDNAELRFVVSSLYLQAKDYAKAIALFSDKKHQVATYGGVDYVQGIQAYYNGDVAKALTKFEKALAVADNEYLTFSDDSQKIVNEQIRLTLYQLLGETYFEQKQYTRSIKFYTKAIGIDKGNVIIDAKLKIAMLLYQARRDPQNSGLYAAVGYYYSLLHLNTQAAAYYIKAIELYPRSATAYLGLGLAYKNTLNYPKAKEAFEQGLRYANPDIAAALYCELGQICLEYGQLSDAVSILSKAADLAPDNTAAVNELKLAKYKTLLKTNPAVSVNITLGEIYTERQRYDQALAYFSAAEKKEPNEPRLLLGKARVYFLTNKYAYAAAAYRKVLKKTDSQTAVVGLIDVYTAEEHYDQAVDLLREVLKKDPDNVLIHNKLASVYFTAGQNENAVREWRWVLDHINNDEMAGVINNIIGVIS
jgi:tetratricopeptide (TPR) repeat protein